VTEPTNACPHDAYVRARVSRDPGERLLAHMLDALSSIAAPAVAAAFSVDERGLMQATMTRRAPGHDRYEVTALFAQLRRLEPIDPFNPRRAEACGASLLSAADAGDVQRHARSMHGELLRRHGYGTPVVLYFRVGGQITAGVTLLREWDGPRFDEATIRLLRRLHPMLEQSFSLAGAKPIEPILDDLSELAALTARETEVARLVAGGQSNAGTAQALSLSEATVKAHLTKVYAKLGVRTRTQLAVVMGGLH
jgi:DNA-binding CsgD family transcriptional regulator